MPFQSVQLSTAISSSEYSLPQLVHVIGLESNLQTKQLLHHHFVKDNRKGTQKNPVPCHYFPWRERESFLLQE